MLCVLWLMEIDSGCWLLRRRPDGAVWWFVFLYNYCRKRALHIPFNTMALESEQSSRIRNFRTVACFVFVKDDIAVIRCTSPFDVFSSISVVELGPTMWLFNRCRGIRSPQVLVFSSDPCLQSLCLSWYIRVGSLLPIRCLFVLLVDSVIAFNVSKYSKIRG